MAEQPFKSPELQPQIIFLFDLMAQLVDGRIRIPQFQRPFVWRPQQMVDLLDSIGKQYPIGSLLAWETDEEIFSLQTVGPIQLAPRALGAASYLLDGHQRLSTLAGALVSESNRTAVISEQDAAIWRIYFNAEDRSFEHVRPGETPPPYVFPMSRVLDTFEFLEASQQVLAHEPERGRTYVERIQEMARSFQNYKIPVIQIRQTGLSEAVEIFARLNSRGQSMTADQMVSALLYRQDRPRPFNLADAISDAIDSLRPHGFGDIDRTLVLRLLLAAIGEDIYRTDWTRLAHGRREALLERLESVLPDVKGSLQAAVRFLEQELGVTTARLLPYGMQLTVLAAFFFAQPSPSHAQISLLKKWFWVTSFSAWFGGANPSRVNALVRDAIDNVAKDLHQPAFESVDLSTPAIPLPRSFDMRSARTRALLLMLLSMEPRDRNGDVIERVDELIRLNGPEALGYVISRVDDRDAFRSPANRIVRERADDRGQAKNWLLTVGPEMRAAVWQSHAIPLEAGAELEAPDGSAFVRMRLDKLKELERRFMADRDVVPPTSDTPAVAVPDADAEQIEGL